MNDFQQLKQVFQNVEHDILINKLVYEMKEILYLEKKSLIKSNLYLR